MTKRTSPNRTTPASALQPGDHIKVSRGIYSHHGIYVGGGLVIHYAGERKPALLIEEATLVVFARRRRIRVVDYGQRFDPAVIVARARSRLGERMYDLVGNNCEHFARWCSANDEVSEQVRDVAGSATAVGGGALAATIGVAVVGAAAAAGIAGGAQIMSGLAGVGGIVGGGALAGVGVLAAIPALAAGVGIWISVRDPECLSEEERKARRIGRLLTIVGAGLGLAATLFIISRAGRVLGFSAPGITTGLAKTGSVLGGGMLAGVFLLALLPGLLAAGLGYGAYRLARWWLALGGEVEPLTVS